METALTRNGRICSGQCRNFHMASFTWMGWRDSFSCLFGGVACLWDVFSAITTRSTWAGFTVVFPI